MASTYSRQFVWASFALFTAAAWSGCASTPKEVVSVARADLACDQVEIAEVSKNRFAATGCGKGAVYMHLCSGGAGCQWARLRGVGEVPETSGGVSAAAPNTPAPPREIIAAPPPAQREVIPAPPPGESAPREIIPAPPPQDGALKETPLSQGTLSDPYQAEVPATPTVQRVEYPPPAPLVETPPPAPVHTHIWVGGYWWWANASWVWAPGYWCPPRPGFAYVPGRWYWASNYWWYGPGGWARPGSTVIAYHPAPRPVRVVAVRSFTPNRVYGAPVVAPRYAGSLVQGGSRVRVAPAPAPRAFAPRSSPMYRYPTALSSPTHLPPRTLGASRGSFGRPQQTLPRPSYGTPRGVSPSYPSYGSSPRGDYYRDASRARVSPGPSVVHGNSFSPSRAPSPSPSPSRGGVVAPRGTSFRANGHRR
jgi:hypothetical protein